MTTTIPFGHLDSPTSVAVAPDGSKVYVSNATDDTVSVIATATNTVTATITVGSTPQGLTVTPDGSKVYVANFGGRPAGVQGNLSVIDTGTNTVTTTITVGSNPVAFGLFIHPAPRFAGIPGFSNCRG